MFLHLQHLLYSFKINNIVLFVSISRGAWNVMLRIPSDLQYKNRFISHRCFSEILNRRLPVLRFI